MTTEKTPEGQPDCYFPLNQRVKVVHLDIDFNADYHKPLFAKWWGHMLRMRAYERALRAYIQQNGIKLCISLCGKEIAFLRHLPCRTLAELHFSKNQRRQLLEANHTGLFWSLLGRIRTWQLVRAVKPLKRLVVLTKADQEDWQKEGCMNVTVIPNICSLDGLKIPMKSREKSVLAVGRLHEQKGFDLLLQAWKVIEQKHPEWTLRIVGEGPKHSELGKQIRDLELKHVCLAGRTKNMAKEYVEASIFVLSSRYEGLPLVLAEAMWCGTPCVSFDCPHGPAELLADERGWLAPNGDIEALTAQIEYVIGHPEDADLRAKKAQTYAQNTYSEEAIMPRWVKEIEDASNI
ncbi:MAG: glycosyltransferase [Paludibacteraceae bacterium]|nr:glycosyltransferase [Paludibacteraceae bacterium]